MTRGKAEDAGGLTPAKDDNAAPYHFDRRSLPIFKCVDYTYALSPLPPRRRKHVYPAPTKFPWNFCPNLLDIAVLCQYNIIAIRV